MIQTMGMNEEQIRSVCCDTEFVRCTYASVKEEKRIGILVPFIIPALAIFIISSNSVHHLAADVHWQHVF